MKQAGLPRTRPLALRLLLPALLATAGCGDVQRAADSYRVQRGLWRAYRFEQELRLRSTQPDSTSLLALRERFLSAAREVPSPERVTGAPGRRTRTEVRLLRVLGQSEIEAARLAFEARRPDLALERCRALASLAEGDTVVLRRADIMIAGSLQRLGRHEEAIEVMKAMLVRYVPHAPDSAWVEDFILGIPSVIVDTRRRLGDEAAAARELLAAERYYEGLLLRGGLDPRLETQVRVRLVRTLLERGVPDRTLAQLDTLENRVRSMPALSQLIPEIAYTRAKLHSMVADRPADAVEMLLAVAYGFPNTRVAPAALLDAAVLQERANDLEAARKNYEAVAAYYPGMAELAASALFRKAMLEDRAGRWPDADLILKSLPVRYPQTRPGAEAPIAIAEHYARARNPEGIRAAMRSAISIYNNMIRQDSTSATVPTLRWNLFRCQVGLDLAEDALRTVDEMAQKHPSSPFTAQALMQGVRVAEGEGQGDRAEGYCLRLVRDFAGSPQADQARRWLDSTARERQHP
jgi:tetratricopeptide (TPR) repeat protein